MSIILNNISVPDFMDLEFFQAVLKDGLKNKMVQLNKVYFTMGPKLGENYCSDIFRATATYNQHKQKDDNDRTIALIIKLLPENGLRESCIESAIFPHERDIYVEALTNISDLLGGEGIAPRFLYFKTYPLETIVFEDVTPAGYVLADRAKGLNEDHCALVFRKLAKFHASSMQLAQNNPKLLQKYHVYKYFDNPGIVRGMTINLEHLAKVCAKWPGFEETAVKLQKFIPKLQKNFPKWMTPSDDELKVLTHNDLWTNNILFKYNDGKLEDLYFIDFQLTLYTSPGHDICHLLYTSLQFDVLEQKRDYMIQECYYKTFKETLEILGYTPPIPTLEQILEEIYKCELSGLTWGAGLKLSNICMDPELSGENSVDSLADPVKGPRIREIGMSTERYVKTMQYVLRHMENIGVLE